MDARLFFDPELLQADIRLEGASIAEEQGLETALLLSIFSDRRAEDDDELPTAGGQGIEDRRGYWGDDFPDVPGDRFGSRLWLLSRAKATQETLNQAIEYLEECLFWLLEDGVASAVDVTGEWLVRGPGEKIAAFRVEIAKPAGPEISFRFQYVWSGVV